MEKYRWLAAIIAAHPERKVVGRTRLQKTVRLLQRLGLPTTYPDTLFFYGPYSEGVQAEIGLLEKLGLISETACQSTKDDSIYYILKATPEAISERIAPFQKNIDEMSQADAVVLELAATYDAFRDMGSDHQEALEALRRKKGRMCDGGREALALELLRKLGWPVE